MTDMIYTFVGGRLVQSVTSVTVVNDTTKTIDTTVPAGKRWLLLSIKVMNPDSVQRSVFSRMYKEAALTNETVTFVIGNVAAGGQLQWPSGSGAANQMNMWHLRVLNAGNTLRVQWTTGGASAGGTDADGLVIEYLEVSL